jgi:tetratricopeptide (TPR) repeat protein
MSTHQELLADGRRHHQAGRLHEAEGLYRRVLAADPRNPAALHLLGLVAHQAGQSEAAVSLIGEAIKHGGEVSAYYNNLGEAYRQLGRFADAISSYQRAIALDDRFAEAHNNLGTIYQNQGSPEQALACYEAAIACQSEYVNAHYNRARAWLTLGDFARGWKEYEWRWRRPEFGRTPMTQPEWDGAPLAGRRLLVRWEQGLGDTLQFVRYVNDLESAGEKVVAMVQPALIPLLAQSGFASVVPAGEPIPPFDVQAMLLSLPYLLGTTLETVPATIPYLSAAAPLVERWRRRLAATAGRFRVGIFWQGNPRSPLEPWRSILLAAFEPLARIAGVELISLQKGPGSEQVRDVAESFPVTDWSAEIDQSAGAFMDTAAIMTALDLVVTSDSATAHLAGALGVDVWVALPHSADFRWLQTRSDSPWYPTMRLFRQRQLGVWPEVFAEIRAALERRMKDAPTR